MRTQSTFVVTLTWVQARALAYASSLGINAKERWANAPEDYRSQATDARAALLAATANFERRHSTGSVLSGEDRDA